MRKEATVTMKLTAPLLLAVAAIVQVVIRFALSDIITIMEFAGRRWYVTIL